MKGGDAMKPDQKSLLTRRERLKNQAQVFRCQDHECLDDMMILARLLSQQALIDAQLSSQGIAAAPTQEKPTADDDECPF